MFEAGYTLAQGRTMRVGGTARRIAFALMEDLSEIGHQQMLAPKSGRSYLQS